MNDTPTPITDEATLLATDIEQGGTFNAVHVQVAQRLERELTAAREELAEWSILNGWGGTPEIINEFIKGQQTRIYYERNLEEDLTLAQEEITLLKNAIANNNDAARAEYIDLKEQRDRLAEALERILDYQGRFAEEEPESIAKEALKSLIPNK